MKDWGKLLVAPLAGLLLIGAAGCGGVGVARVSDMQTVDLVVDYPEGDEPLLEIGLGAAEVQADSDGEMLLEGTVEYNVVGLRPEVYESRNSVEIRQTANVNPVGMENNWELHFGRERPYRLKLNAGAYDGTWDLGGLPLRGLEIAQGASRSTFNFSEPNPETMERLRVTTGAATLTMRNLANAGFEQMSFDGGASTYTLDFSGELQRSGQVNINAGVASLTIVVPEETPVRIVIRESVANVDADSELERSGNHTYVTPAWEENESGPRLTIEISMGLGSVQLRTARATGSTL